MTDVGEAVLREAEPSGNVVALALHLHGQHLQEGHPPALHAVQEGLEVCEGGAGPPQPLQYNLNLKAPGQLLQSHHSTCETSTLTCSLCVTNHPGSQRRSPEEPWHGVGCHTRRLMNAMLPTSETPVAEQ